MRPRWFLFASLATLSVACGGDPPKGPDATIFCTQTIYDPCMTEHDCSATQCQGLGGGLLVCTVACTPGDTSCPADSKGGAATCGSDSYCHPAAANDCVIQAH